jgi:putative FmdB family regulatory protein
MPLYEYSCQQCNHTFEALVFDGEAVECPQCRGDRLERLLSVPAKPQAAGEGPPMACNSSGPPCGAPWCRRT